ncbi:MAG: class I SAM-dependent methyltransferase, partial [Bacteroidota bacterium]
KDCIPNVVENMGLLLKKGKVIWIKTAPILDITAGLNELDHVIEIHIVSVKNEVKELLWKISSETGKALKFIVADLEFYGKDKKVEILTDQFIEPRSYSNPLTYIYEPSRALMKSGKFDWISSYFGLHKLHRHSHLFTSDNLMEFQGRAFRIEDTIAYQGSVIKKLNIKKANISTRNFPLSVDVLRKKLKIKDGGDTYLFFTTLKDESLAIIKCSKL